MNKYKRKFKKNSSGQLLIVVALAIALLVSSTTIYVYELSKEITSVENYPTNDFILALKHCTKNLMISSLANVSNGGENTILATNLNTLSQVFRRLYRLGTCHLTFSIVNNSNYDSGIWISWTSNSWGVSSAYANFTLDVYGMEANIETEYRINITTLAVLNGFYTRLEGEEKLVNLTCQIYNEEKPALAENITLYYEDLGSWKLVNSSNNLSTTDYGNGTYFFSFTVNTSLDVVQISVHVYDLRGILVQANTTCYEA